VTSLVLLYLVQALELFLQLYLYLIIVRILASWFVSSQGMIMQYLVTTTEPYLALFRRLPLRFGMLDLSPMVAILVLDLLRAFLGQYLVTLI
jgi:YggT family protein